LPDAAYADWVGVLEQAEPNFVAVRHRSGELRRFEADEIVIAHRIVDRPRGRRRPTR
jgi:hypothetical protein